MSTTTIEDLNDDCLLRIFSYLLEDLISISKTSPRFHYVCQHQPLIRTIKLNAACPSKHVDLLKSFKDYVELVGPTIYTMKFDCKQDDSLDEATAIAIQKSCSSLKSLQLGAHVPPTFFSHWTTQLIGNLEQLTLEKREHLSVISSSAIKLRNLKDLRVFQIPEFDLSQLDIVGLQKFAAVACDFRNMSTFLEANQDSLTSLHVYNKFYMKPDQNGFLENVCGILPKLDTLILDGYILPDLGDMKNIKDVRLSRCNNISDTLLKLWQVNKLERLYLDGEFDSRIDYRSLAQMTSLKSLCLARNQSVPANFLDELCDNSFEQVFLTQLNVSWESFKRFVKSSPKMKYLRISNVGLEVSNDDYDELMKLRPGLILEGTGHVDCGDNKLRYAFFRAIGEYSRIQHFPSYKHFRLRCCILHRNFLFEEYLCDPLKYPLGSKFNE